MRTEDMGYLDHEDVDGDGAEGRAAEKKDYGKGTCPTCEREFVKRRGWATFCSDRCRMRHHQEFRSEAVNEYRKMLKLRVTGTEA
jgi:hypothetical protein